MNGTAFIVLVLAAFVAVDLYGQTRNDLMTGSTSNPGFKVRAIAAAIAQAEGYGVPGVLPTLRNNPGDLEDATGIIKTYATVDQGWAALYGQVTKMTDGTSQIYDPSMTWVEIAKHYDGEISDDPENPGTPLYMRWALNVSRALHVDPNSTLQEFMDA